jgi:hypothetical protein
MQPLQGKNWFLLASQPQGGAPLTLGYFYAAPSGQKSEPRVLICRKTRDYFLLLLLLLAWR